MAMAFHGYCPLSESFVHFDSRREGLCMEQGAEPAMTVNATALVLSTMKTMSCFATAK